jgi:hypothetical protein
MRRKRKTRVVRGMAVLLAAGASVGATACGEDDFENEARPPVPIELTGVIQEDEVTVSPNGIDRKIGAGPILITISNQTKDAHTVTLEGESVRGPSVRERTSPINPLDTATIQKTLREGDYEVRAGSEVAVPKEIEPAELRIGPPRKSSSDRLLLP